MSDVKDILGIASLPPKDNANEVPIRMKRVRSLSLPSSQPPKKKRKSGGLAREVAALTEGQEPQQETSLFKDKPRFKKFHADRWKWSGFINRARNDKAIFHHWKKATDPSGESKFASFNIKPLILEYTNEQYDSFCICTEWTRPQTDYLMSMAKQFEIKFFIIQDRWNTTLGGVRSIEDIKDRFYSVQRMLLNVHPNKNTDKSLVDLQIKLTYDKERELAKKQSQTTKTKTEEDIKEDEAITQQYQQIQKAMRNTKKEAEKLIKMTQSAIQTVDKKKGKPTHHKAVLPNTRLSLRVQESQELLTRSLNELGLQDVVKNPASKVVSQRLGNVKSLLTLLFEIQKSQAESSYLLEVLKLSKQSLLDEFSQQGEKNLLELNEIDENYNFKDSMDESSEFNTKIDSED